MLFQGHSTSDVFGLLLIVVVLLATTPTYSFERDGVQLLSSTSLSDTSLHSLHNQIAQTMQPAVLLKDAPFSIHNTKTVVYSATQQQTTPTTYSSVWEPLIVTTVALGLVVGLFSLRSQ